MSNWNMPKFSIKWVQDGKIKKEFGTTITRRIQEAKETVARVTRPSNTAQVNEWTAALDQCAAGGSCGRLVYMANLIERGLGNDLTIVAGISAARAVPDNGLSK
jgi:hypothetical protein